MIKSLTSLRFIFAFMVFMSHNQIVSNTPLLNHLFYEGYAGVSFFFILSGFILTYSYHGRFKKNEINIKDFYKARFARIYPLHFLTFVLVLILFQRPVLNLNYFVKFFSNITLLQSFFPSKSIYFSFNAPSWSISDEMFFYVMFPFLLFLLFKRKMVFFVSLFFFCILFFIFSFIVDEKYQHFVFYINPWFRILDFSLGIFLYEISCFVKRNLSKENIQKWSNIFEPFSIFLFLMFYLFAYNINQVYRFSFWYWIPMCFLILVFFVSRDGVLSKFLSNRYLVLLGEVSFGFYLFHQIVGRFFYILFSRLDVEILYPISFSLNLIVSLTISYYSFKYYETPCNRILKKKLGLFNFKKI